MPINISIIYLAAAAITIFTAGLLAAIRLPRRLRRKRILIIALVSLIAVLVLWYFVGVMSRPHEEKEGEAPESTG